MNLLSVQIRDREKRNLDSYLNPVSTAKAVIFLRFFPSHFIFLHIGTFSPSTFLVWVFHLLVFYEKEVANPSYLKYQSQNPNQILKSKPHLLDLEKLGHKGLKQNVGWGLRRGGCINSVVELQDLPNKPYQKPIIFVIPVYKENIKAFLTQYSTHMGTYKVQ